MDKNLGIVAHVVLSELPLVEIEVPCWLIVSIGNNASLKCRFIMCFDKLTIYVKVLLIYLVGAGALGNGVGDGAIGLGGEVLGVVGVDDGGLGGAGGLWCLGVGGDGRALLGGAEETPEVHHAEAELGRVVGTLRHQSCRLTSDFHSKPFSSQFFKSHFNVAINFEANKNGF